jgi:geranylgeranyl reductase family protein
VRPAYDVIVAGAGPAGAAMAARLLRERPAERILVLDRYSFPREKPCGGGLTGHIDRALAETGLALEVPAFPAASARVRFGSFERLVELDKPVQVIRREEFDASLVDQVRRRGVTVVEDEGVEAYAAGADRVTVKTSRGRELDASVLVGCDGAASVVRKQLLAEKALPHRLFKLEYSLPLAQAAPCRGDAMLYDFTPMRSGLRGYLWVFPVPGDRVNVGLMHYPAHRLGGPALIDMLRGGLAELGMQLPARGTHGWPVWGYHPGKKIAGPRVLAVGDAAGIDGLTGEGIAVAMEQALVAGDAIDLAFARNDFGFRGFRRQVRKAVVGRELALDRWLARLLYGSRNWQRWLSLVLFDPQVIEMYAARVDGSQILADQKLRLFRALFRHIWRARSRRKQLNAA